MYNKIIKVAKWLTEMQRPLVSISLHGYTEFLYRAQCSTWEIKDKLISIFLSTLYSNIFLLFNPIYRRSVCPSLTADKRIRRIYSWCYNCLLIRSHRQVKRTSTDNTGQCLRSLRKLGELFGWVYPQSGISLSPSSRAFSTASGSSYVISKLSSMRDNSSFCAICLRQRFKFHIL